MKREMVVAGKKIGDTHPTFIIAEAGSNHNVDINMAKKLIDAASDAKADAVKFQIFKSNLLSSDKKEKYILRDYEFKRSWISKLDAYAKKKNIIFLATPFDLEAVDALDAIDIPAFKIASGDLTCTHLIEYIAKKKKPIFLSVGLGTIAEIKAAIETINQNGNKNVAILHCNVSYPTNPEDVNLNVIKTLRDLFSNPIGFSDHTLGISVPVASIALGACVIEKHFTLDKSLKGPDHFYALEPDELKKMVEAIRTVEKAFGSKEKFVTESEKENLVGSRRSIYAKDKIKKGSIINSEMITTLRPCIGIEAKDFNLVVGKRTSRKINKGEALQWNDLSD